MSAAPSPSSGASSAPTPPPARETRITLERHVRAPRETTWRVLCDTIEELAGPYVVEGDPPPHGVGARLHLPHPAGGELVETVVSFEPPWRRVYIVEGDTGLALYQGTFSLRDDGPESHLAWCVVADPEPGEAGRAFLDTAVAVIGDLCDLVVTRAEAADAGG